MSMCVIARDVKQTNKQTKELGFKENIATVAEAQSVVLRALLPRQSKHRKCQQLFMESFVQRRSICQTKRQDVPRQEMTKR